MFLKNSVAGCFFIGASVLNVAGQANNIRVFVSQEVRTCVSFNAVQTSPNTKFEQMVVCPGDNQYFNNLPDGIYELFATPVDYVSKALYGNFSHINNPIFIGNDSSLAVYFPSSFRENR